MVNRIVCLICCWLVLWVPGSGGVAAASTGGQCLAAPALPAPSGKVVRVNTVASLQSALANAREKTTIVIAPGRYQLQNTLSVTVNHITIRGESNRCDDVHLVGAGMDNADHQGVRFGFWVSAAYTTIANLTISDVYYHAIQIDGKAHAPHIHNVRLVDIGQQFIKSNPDQSGGGVDEGVVAYSIMEYSNGTPKTDHDNSGIGYTNGVDVHAGKDWRIRNNRFKNFHTPDSADHLWNAAVLMWRGASGTITENNFFINVDRAIAYGLGEEPGDHRGGVIRNNVVLMTPGLYSRMRRLSADAAVVVWHSPQTQVLHNTIITNGNIPFSIETRFDGSGVVMANNLTDAPVVQSEGDVARNLCKVSGMCRKFFTRFSHNNVSHADADWFMDIATGDARLRPGSRAATPALQRYDDALHDFTGSLREISATAGAFEMPKNAAMSE